MIIEFDEIFGRSSKIDDLVIRHQKIVIFDDIESNLNLRYSIYSIISLRTTGEIEICSPYQEFVLTGAFKIEKAMKGKKKSSY